MYNDTWDRAMMKLDHAKGTARTLGELFYEADADRGGALYGIADLLEDALALLDQDRNGPRVVDLAAE